MKQGIFMRDIKAESKDAVIDIVGVIGWDTGYLTLRDMLRTIPEAVERVIFKIYSPGGSVWEGNGVIQEIGALKQTTVAHVQVAASMATSVAVACDVREMAANGRFLVHNPWTSTEGDADAMEKRAKELRDCETEAAAFYAKRTGKTTEEMLALMDEERWLTPQETLDLGFVQKINDPFDAAAYEGVRAEIKAAGKWPMALAEIMKAGEKAETFSCECVDCGETIETETHCKDLKCEKCGGQMRRKERPGPGKEKQEGEKDDADPKGTKGDAPKEAGKPDKPADAPPPFQDFKDGFASGFADGKAESGILHAKQLAVITDTMAELTKKHDSSEAAGRKLQADRDTARAQVEKLTAALTESTGKLEKMLAGGMTFSPTVETWEEVLRECEGNYEKARQQFPELFKVRRAQDKANRK